MLVHVAEHPVFTSLLLVLVWASEPCAGCLTPACCYRCGYLMTGLLRVDPLFKAHVHAGSSLIPRASAAPE